MTLFEECKEALGDNFSLVAPSDQKGVVDLLHSISLPMEMLHGQRLNTRTTKI